jgi:hypothetical protein
VYVLPYSLTTIADSRNYMVSVLLAHNKFCHLPGILHGRLIYTAAHIAFP